MNNESGQSTETAHNDYTRRMREEFTPIERQIIRYALFGNGVE